LKFEVRFKLPQGYKLNPLAKVNYTLAADGAQNLIAANQLNARRAAESDGQLASISIPLSAQSGEAKLTLSVSFSYCRDGVGGLCKLQTSRWSIPVKVAADGKTSTIQVEASAE
jgi:hypothetical protein